jgi:hypothetical protein
MHLDPTPTPTHISSDIDLPLDDHEIPQAREYVKRVKEETRGEIKAFLAWQSM